MFAKTLTKSKICLVVKCNAYGHGAVETSKYTEDIVDCFAVANKFEALQLTNSGITKDILVLSDLFDGGHYPNNVIFTAFSEIGLNRLIFSGRRFCIKVDTGMNRVGFRPEKLSEIFSVADKKNIHSIFSHIYDYSSIAQQTRIFESCTCGCGIPRHIYASNFHYAENRDSFDFVRLGIMAYGYGHACVKPVMSLYAPIVQVKTVKKGCNVGYGINSLAEDLRIGTAGIGYGDGFRRKKEVENRTVFVGGQYCSVVGQICMDACMIDLSNVKSESEEIEILGKNITADKIAKEWNTIPYDVLTSFSKARANIKYLK